MVLPPVLRSITESRGQAAGGVDARGAAELPEEAHGRPRFVTMQTMHGLYNSI